MAVENYNISGCSYNIGKLDKYVYFLEKESIGKIEIDNGAAYVVSATSAMTLESTSISLEEGLTLDERWEFTHSLKFTVKGYMNNKGFANKYYVIVVDKNGVYWLLNPQMPCKITYTYTVDGMENQTEFTFAAKSNYPMLQVKNFTPSNENTCNGYYLCGIKDLFLNESNYSLINEEGVKYTNDGFKSVKFSKDSCVLQEQYDGANVTHSVKFNIELSDYKSSWHYNLIEFANNKYSAVLTTKCNTNIGIGFDHGLQASYAVKASNDEVDSIEITLSHIHDEGNVIWLPSDVDIRPDENVFWIWVDGEFDCISTEMAYHLLQEKVDAQGNSLDEFMCLEGWQSHYSYLGDKLIGTYSSASTEPFICSECRGYGCNITTSLPTLVNFTSLGSKQYSLRCDSSWTIGTSDSGITVSPNNGNANQTYTITLTNNQTPTLTPTEHLLTLNYCNTARRTIVKVEQANPYSCFPQGTAYTVTSIAQSFNVPTTCCINSVSFNVADVSGEIQEGYIRVWVSENQTGSARTITMTVTLCDNTTQTIAINQESFFSRWVTESRQCNGVEECDFQRLYSGNTDYDINTPTYITRWTNCSASTECSGVNTRWVQTSDTTCQDGKRWFIEVYQVYQNGEWMNTGYQRIGAEAPDPSHLCAINIEHWVAVEGYLCEETGKYEKLQLFIEEYDGQPQEDWIPQASYRRGALIEADSQTCGGGGSGYLYQEWREDGTMCNGVDKYTRQRLYGSNDGELWIQTLITRQGAILEPNSEDCGYVPTYEYNWRTSDLTECQGYDSYGLYVKQRRISGSSDAWEDVVPTETSYNGEGTKQPYNMIHNAAACGYVPPVEPIYRWVNMDVTSYYYCQGTTKYYKQQRQVSTDSGTTWVWVYPPEYQMGVSAETQSVDCGYVPSPRIYKWEIMLPVSGDPNTYICDECDEPTPPTPPTSEKYVFTYLDTSTRSGACDSTSAVTSADTQSQDKPSSAITSVELGDCVTEIGDSAFAFCDSLQTVVMTDNVTSIGNGAFNFCESLTSITLSNNLVTIGNRAFVYCTSLETVTIPESVETIDYIAFAGCSNLQSITCLAETPPTLGGNDVFDDTNNCQIYVPSASVEAYKTANNWSTYASRIQAIPNS